MIKTSDTHPLRIDSVQLPYVNGIIGMTFCPGKKGASLFSGTWGRDLAKDFATLCDWGTNALVTLIEGHEFGILGVPDFGEKVENVPFKWFHLPIIDASVPDCRFEQSWRHTGNEIRGILASGGKVVLHCRGGLGRTGLLAARLLVEFGVEPDEAIKQVRKARPGAIETSEQEKHIHNYKAKNSRRTLDHYQGCLLGGAIGDALGAAVEFTSLPEIRNKYGPSDIQNYDVAFGRVGALTDDTQMTLFTAEGLLRALTRAKEKGIGPAYPSVTYYAYRRWLLTQGELKKKQVREDGWLIKIPELFSCRAPGNTCLSALHHNKPFLLQNGDAHNMSKGCGAVMRMAPVGLFFQSPYLHEYSDSRICDEEAFVVGQSLGYLTHGHPTGYLSAAFLGILIGRIIDGDDLNSALDKAYGILEKHHHADETMAAINKAREFASKTVLPPCGETIERLGGGWVGEEALAIGIYCALVAKEDFDFGIRLAVNHSGDSDSTGAITGNILGAILGRKAISNHWLERLELREVIEQVATDLFLCYQSGDAWWDRYPGW